MAKAKKLVPIKLDKVRHLYYNLNALEIIEDLTGKPIDQVGESINMKTLKVLVYAGLIFEDKSITLEEVGDMIGFEDIENVSNAIGEAFKGLS